MQIVSQKVCNDITFVLLVQRKWATLSLNQEVEVAPHQFDVAKTFMSSIVLEADFLQKKR